jgi:hypothetical protein
VFLLITPFAVTSCGRKQPRIFYPPPLAARVQTIAEVPELPAPPDLTFGFAVSDDAELWAAATLPGLPPPPAPPAPAKPKPQVPVAIVEPPPTADAPRLVQIFTPDQERSMRRELQDTLARVETLMGGLRVKNLRPADREILTTIETFQKQAEQARDQDLVTAVSLAKRADQLAKDLSDRLR